MKQNLKQGGLYILQIILTALASALIALLQNWLAAHGAHTGQTISPENTAVIGGGISAAAPSLHRFSKLIKIT